MDERKETISPVTIFYSYAHEDEPLRQELEKHLSGLRQQGLIREWHNRQIVAGTEWAYAIDRHLNTASVILLLISPDFFASDYCYSIEMQRAMERHRLGEACVIPILLRPVDWQGAPFAQLQCVPRDARPVTIWPNRDEAFLEVTRGIRIAIESLRFSSDMTLPRSLPFITSSPSLKAQRVAGSVISKEQNRQRMLARVSTIWIKGLLEQSLHGAALILLGLNERSDVVDNPWRLVVQELGHSTRSLPPGTHIAQVYNDANGELLILGEPGAGKTTLLLSLAKDLLERARQDDTFPIPVIFNLASWASKRQSITKWLVEELSTKYGAPRRLAQSWLDADQVHPLLDGLDEVPAEHRAGCIEAINSYRQKHGWIPMVVCSRSAEYLTGQRRISLRRAVVIQPLSIQQIDEYLINLGEQLAPVRVVLHDDPVLQELVATPLMLSITTLAYHGKPIADRPLASSPEVRRRQVFAAFVQSMLQRRGIEGHYTAQQTVYWLAWLAKQLIQHNQTEFYIEQMQPDWLPTRWLRWLYRGLVVLIVLLLFLCLGMVSGLIIWLELPSLTRPGLNFADSMGTGLTVGGFTGFILGLIGGLTKGIRPVETLAWSWKRAFQGCATGLVMLAGLAATVWTVLTVTSDLQQPVLIGGLLVTALVSIVMGKANFSVLFASPRKLTLRNLSIKWVAQGIGCGLLLFCFFLCSFLSGLGLIVFTTLLYTWPILLLLLALVYGISLRSLDSKHRIRPNQGIRRSRQYSLITGLGLLLLIFFIWLGFLSLSGMLSVAIASNEWNFLLSFTLVAIVSWALPLTLIVGLVMGGMTALKHAILRAFLWVLGVMPPFYVHFLDYSAERILLRKVGGGYIFIHRLLLNYFSSLDTVSDPDKTTRHT